MRELGNLIIESHVMGNSFTLTFAKDSPWHIGPIDMVARSNNGKGHTLCPSSVHLGYVPLNRGT